MTPPFSWRKYGRYFLTGLAFMYGFKTLDSLLEKTAIVQRMERANLDALFSGKKTEVSKDIFIVTVTEEDYSQLFGGVSPLQPSKLNEVISAILESGPKVLGVDFDTSAWKDVGVRPPAGTTIVWAKETVGNLSSKDVCYGVPVYVPNEDGFIRDYSAYVEGNGQAFPTLAVNLAEVYLKGTCLNPLPLNQWKKTEPLPLINYAGDATAFNRLSASALLQLKGSEDDPGAATRWALWKNENPLKGKLVLLGGAYRAARDAYPTPVGYLDGVVILAHTAQTRLPGHELRSDAPKGLLNGWLSIQAYVLLLATYFIPKAWRMGITILTGPIYAFIGNWIWFFAGGTFLSFVPYLVGLTVHQIYDHIKDFRKLEKDNHNLKERLRVLESPTGD